MRRLLPIVVGRKDVRSRKPAWCTHSEQGLRALCRSLEPRWPTSKSDLAREMSERQLTISVNGFESCSLRQLHNKNNNL